MVKFILANNDLRKINEAPRGAWDDKQGVAREDLGGLK